MGDSSSRHYRDSRANEKGRLDEDASLLATITEKPLLSTQPETELDWKPVGPPAVTVTAGAADMAVHGADWGHNLPGAMYPQGVVLKSLDVTSFLNVRPDLPADTEKQILHIAWIVARKGNTGL